MPRETKEEREARQAREEQEKLAATAAYRATILIRMMEAQALARTIGISAEVSLINSGPSVRFSDNHLLDETITYETEEWELEYLERQLREKKEEQDIRVGRRLLAEETWKKLSQSEKAALKENITYLYL